jgi:hypothetical protein
MRKKRNEQLPISTYARYEPSEWLNTPYRFQSKFKLSDLVGLGKLEKNPMCAVGHQASIIEYRFHVHMYMEKQ